MLRLLNNIRGIKSVRGKENENKKNKRIRGNSKQIEKKSNDKGQLCSKKQEKNQEKKSERKKIGILKKR